MALEMKYFVLKPKGAGSYAEASRRAMVAYAQSIRPVDKELADALLAWAEKESMETYRRRRSERL